MNANIRQPLSTKIHNKKSAHSALANNLFISAKRQMKQKYYNELFENCLEKMFHLILCVKFAMTVYVCKCVNVCLFAFCAACVRECSFCAFGSFFVLLLQILLRELKCTNNSTSDATDSFS